MLLSLGVVGAGVVLAAKPLPAPLPIGMARVLPGDAAVTVRRGTPVAAADAQLRAGDTLIVDHGIAALRTNIGTLYASAGSAIAITNGAPRVTRGDVLVKGKEITVAMHAASATINGIVRMRQGLTSEVDVYRGAAVMNTATETIGVLPLRRAVMSGNGSSLVTIAPLVVNALDKWDREFLGTAIELDAALNARSRGLTMQVAGDSQNVVGKVLSETGFGPLTLLPNEALGEFVVAAELAKAAHLGREGIAAALNLRAQGASWGLIALEQGVHTLPATLAGIENEVVPAADAVTGSLPPLVPVTPAPPASGSSTPVTTPPPATKPPTFGGTTDVTTPPVTPPVPGDNPVAHLVDGVDNLLGGLLGH